jgi:mRNA interferase RelE/StbE
MLKCSISKQASKFLAKAHPKHAKQIACKLFELQQNPFPHDSIQLKGQHSNLHRTNVGEYRVIYFIKENILFILIIGKRNDGEVYKLLTR